MYSLFLLLFRKSYWRMLLRKATWIEAWLSLTRAHKDRRARRHLGRLSLLLVVPVLCVAYAFWLIGSGAWIILPLLAPILWWQNRRRNEDQAPVRITPGPEPLVRPMTARERELLALMAEGHSNTAIARRLVLSASAVEKHIGNVFAKLGLPPDDAQHRRVLAVLAYLRA